jgi:choline monooxygenase
MKSFDTDATASPFEVLSVEEVGERLQGPLESVRGLPSTAYNSPEFFDLERSRLFSRTWVFAGRLSEIPNWGDRHPVDVAGQPLFISRGEDGSVRAFHNVCPHRGARIVPEPSRGQSIVCPYHAWTFHLDGRLRARPHYHGPGNNDVSDTDVADSPCLIEVPSAVWIDWLFVNIDGQAPPFEDYIAPLSEKWQEFDLSDLHCLHQLMVEYRCNWKLAIENYCDFYHVFKVHPDLHESLSTKRRTAMMCDRAILHNETWTHDTHASFSTQENPMALPHLGGKLEGNRRRTVFAVIFPNCAVNIHRSDVQFSYFEPISPTVTRLHRYFYFRGDTANNPSFEPVRKLIYADWERVLREDEGVCQLIQDGRKSKAYDGGRLAPAWDEGTRYFHQLVTKAFAVDGHFTP